MYEVLKGILVDDLQMRAEDVTPTAGRVEVGLDSLTAVELSSVLNVRLGIEIHDYELLELATLGDVARLVEERHLAAAVQSVPHPSEWVAGPDGRRVRERRDGAARSVISARGGATDLSGKRW